MKSVNIKSVKEGDVLAKEVIVGKVGLFDAGTVLVKRSIEIMTVLGVETVEIVSEEGGKFRNIKEVFQNIDERFSYVEHDPFMISLKYVVKDVVSNVRGYK